MRFARFEIEKNAISILKRLRANGAPQVGLLAGMLCQVGDSCFDFLLLLQLGMLVIEHWSVVAQALVQWQFQLELSKGCLCGH